VAVALGGETARRQNSLPAPPGRRDDPRRSCRTLHPRCRNPHSRRQSNTETVSRVSMSRAGNFVPNDEPEGLSTESPISSIGTRLMAATRRRSSPTRAAARFAAQPNCNPWVEQRRDRTRGGIGPNGRTAPQALRLFAHRSKAEWVAVDDRLTTAARARRKEGEVGARNLGYARRRPGGQVRPVRY